jgi:17beta-estradiol 17-dehydrogenase / very-long-chain 3-oxoacyl-CoA reductase
MYYNCFLIVGIAEEVKQSNVHVEHCNTLFVQTAMSKIRKPSFFIPTPEQFARKVLKRCGSGYDSTLYPAHEIVDTIASCIPEFFKRNYSSAMHVDIRRRALRKQAREAKGPQ